MQFSIHLVARVVKGDAADVMMAGRTYDAAQESAAALHSLKFPGRAWCFVLQ